MIRINEGVNLGQLIAEGFRRRNRVGVDSSLFPKNTWRYDNPEKNEMYLVAEKGDMGKVLEYHDLELMGAEKSDR